MEKVEVWESVQKEEGKEIRNREYRIRMTFLPHHLYSVSLSLTVINCFNNYCIQDDYVVTPSQVLAYVEEEFIKKLAAQVNKEIKRIREKR